MINQLIQQRYEILEKAGEGPIFAVYKARDKAMNRMVALKTLLSPYASEKEFVATLKEAQQATAVLNHPNITHFQEFGQEGDATYSITEFVRGIDLKERIRRIAPFTLSVAVDFACAIGEAMHYTHSVGQVHGDLRPQNIIISPEGAVKVTNFGVQSAVAKSPQAQHVTLQLAAPYHAPELSTTHPGTAAGDIYALGAILYEMLTGTPVYSAESLDALADKHAFAAIPSPRAINSGVPRSVEGIILKCLQKKPDERYRTVAELLTDLKSVRDALRFGKSLSWSPIDIEKASEAPKRAEPKAPVKTLEPVAEVAASSRPIALPARNRLREKDDRVSIYLKVAIAVVTSIILACAIWTYGTYLSYWALPQSVQLPQITGRPIDEVRALATQMKFRLIEHPEYNDKANGVVFRTDQEVGAKLRPNHSINVWVSKGPEYVDVPKVTAMSREDAEKKLIAVGLKVGKVAVEYSTTVAENMVISQSESFKKRVYHDTVVNLSVSGGPKPEDNPPAEPNSAGNDNGAAAPNIGDTGSETHTAGNTGDESDNEKHKLRRRITIGKDGLGKRQVKIEITDKTGSSVTLIDEKHDESESFEINGEYVGKKITMRIFYNDKLVKEVSFDPEASQGQTIR